MQGIIEEDNRIIKVSVDANKFVDEMHKLLPTARILVIIEDTNIRHSTASNGMTSGDMIGLMQLWQNRLGMFDIEDIRMRMEAAKLKQAQDIALQEMCTDSKMSN